jgi:hypothetical protein
LDTFCGQQKESYQQWKGMLFKDNKAQYDTTLFVIKESDIALSPIHYIPNPTISNVEKELINLLDLFHRTTAQRSLFIFFDVCPIFAFCGLFFCSLFGSKSPKAAKA